MPSFTCNVCGRSNTYPGGPLDREKSSCSRCGSNVRRMLKPNGVLVFTVPYSVEQSTAEHYSDLYEFGFANTGNRTVLVNRTRSGHIQVFENPVFHNGLTGQALEMREFSESDLTG